MGQTVKRAVAIHDTREEDNQGTVFLNPGDEVPDWYEGELPEKVFKDPGEDNLVVVESHNFNVLQDTGPTDDPPAIGQKEYRIPNPTVVRDEEGNAIEQGLTYGGDPTKTETTEGGTGGTSGYAAMSKNELQQLAGERGLDTSGTHRQLVARLEQSDAASG